MTPINSYTTTDDVLLSLSGITPKTFHRFLHLYNLTKVLFNRQKKEQCLAKSSLRG